MSGWLDNTTAYDYFMYSLSLEPLPLLAKENEKESPKGLKDATCTTVSFNSEDESLRELTRNLTVKKICQEE